MTKIRVLLVDDHPLLRAGMTRLIDDQPDLQVCGEVAEASKTLDAIRANKPDVVILDLSMQGENGLEVLKEIKAHHPTLEVLILSMHDETVYAPRALRAGAAGYISKSDPPQQVLEALRRVAAGGTYLSETMSDILLRHAVGRKPGALATPIEVLSDRELEIFTMIGEGHSVREIAAKLGLSGKTVESHRANIKAKLSIETGPALMKQAVTWVTEPGAHFPKSRE